MAALCCTANCCETERTGVVGAQQGVVLLDTLILKQHGRPTGEALIVLLDQVQVEVMLTRNQHILGRNPVGVARATKQARTATPGLRLASAFCSLPWPSTTFIA